MAGPLANIPSNLEALSAKLTRDTDIQSNVRQLATRGRTCVQAYTTMMTSDGNVILAQKELLLKATAPSDVNITKMKSSLQSITSKLKSVRGDVVNMQTHVHGSIESCRARKRQHESEVASKNSTISSLQGQISTAQSNIESCEKDSASFDQSAQELENRAGDIERAARRKRKRGRFGVLGGIVGLALAPVTGGVSLALTAAGAATAHVNFNDAGDCRRNAGKLRSDAATRRQEAANLRSRISTLEGQISTARTEISQLSAANSSLDEAARNLDGLTNSLTSFLTVIDDVLNRFQDMETSFQDTSLHTDSFTIIQRAFSKSGSLTGNAQQCLNQLKERWVAMETILLQNGARAGITSG